MLKHTLLFTLLKTVRFQPELAVALLWLSCGMQMSYGQSNIVLEAECADYSARWDIIEDPLAAGGQALSYPEGSSLSGPSSNPDDFINFEFNVSAAGDYYIWTRVQARGGSRDSYWVIVNNGTPIKFNEIAASDDYLWVKVFDSDNNKAPVKVSLQAGQNTISFGFREALTYLDKIVVKPEDVAPSGFGPDASNCGNVDPCPAPTGWTTMDIGTPAIPGQTCANNTQGIYTLSASGADIWSTNDEFHFMYQTLEGNGEIIARVDQLQNTDEFAKAGVMFRNSLDADALNAMMYLSPVGRWGYQSRTAKGQNTQSNISGAGEISTPSWVRIVREGNAVSGFYSADGSDWQLAGTDQLGLDQMVYVGLALTSHDNSQLNTSVFSNVEIKSSDPADPCVGSSIVYVDQDASGNNDGSSWSNAFTKLEDAVDFANACESVTEVWIAEGEYASQGKLKDLYDSPNVLIGYYVEKDLRFYGGFNGTETEKEQRSLDQFSTIKGDKNTPDNSEDDLDIIFFGVIYTNIFLDGLILEGPESRAVRLDILFTSLNVNNCIFQNLVSGISNIGSGDELGKIELNNSVFQNNKSACRLLSSVLEASNCTFRGNEFALGMGYIGRIVLDHCQVIDNVGPTNSTIALGEAGGYFTDCLFQGNQARKGGVIAATDLYNLVIDRCIFKDNSATERGGVFHFNGRVGDIRNSLFINNKAPEGGVIVSLEYRSEFVNCTIIGSEASTAGAVAYFDLGPVSPIILPFKNCIILNSKGPDLVARDGNWGSFSFENCLLDQNNFPSFVTAENIVVTQDPSFTDASNDDFTLLPTSPAIDAGTDTPWNGITDPKDLAGNDRIQLGRVDIGAYEAASKTTTPPVSGNLSFEAECASVGANWETLDFASASRGQLINYPAGTNLSTPSSNQDDIIKFAVNITEVGSYAVWSRVLALGGSRDSYWVRVYKVGDTPPSAWIKFNNIPASDDLEWRRVFDDDNNDTPLTFNLDAGQYYVEFGWREAGTYLDKVVVQDVNAAAPTGLGPDASNCDEVPPTDPCTGRTIVYVDQDASGNNDGTSWSNAFTKLEDAVEFANSCESISEVWIAQGTFAPKGELTDFSNESNVLVGCNVRRNLSFFGGFNGTETQKSQRNSNQYSVIRGDQNTLSDTSDDLDIILLVSSGSNDDVIFDGLIFEGPSSNALEFDLFILADINNCKFQNLTSAIYSQPNGPSGVIIVNNSEFRNISESGVSYSDGSFRAADSYFENVETVLINSDFSFCSFDRCTFIRNGSDNNSPFWINEARGEFRDCLFEDNRGDFGGVMAITDNNGANVFAERCVFKNNQASVAGGVFYIATPSQGIVRNCLFVDNKAPQGGIMYVGYTTNVDFVNCTFTGSEASEAGDIVYDDDRSFSIRLLNCIETNSKGSTLLARTREGSNFEVINSLLETSSLPSFVSTTNVIFKQDPLFNNPSAGDYSLTIQSPAINAGTNLPWNGINNPIDLAGNNRIFDSTVDLGAYEFQGNVPTPANPLSFEAECAFVGKNWSFLSDPSASNGQVVNYAGSNDLANPPQIIDDLVQFTVDVATPGDYYVWSRVLALGGSRDSYWVRVFKVGDTPPANWIKFNNITPNTQLSWSKVHDDDNNKTPVVFNLEAGQYFVEFGKRESGTYLDKIVVQAISAPAPTGLGPVAQACQSQARRAIKQVTANSSTVYPNPARENVTLKLESAYTGDIQVRIIDFQGREYAKMHQTKLQDIEEWKLNLEPIEEKRLLVYVKYGASEDVIRLIRH